MSQLYIYNVKKKIFELVGFLHELVIKCYMIFIKCKYRKYNTQTIMIFHVFIEHIPLNNNRELWKKHFFVMSLLCFKCIETSLT